MPADWTSEIARVPGVQTATGDVSVDVSLVTGSGEILAGTSDQPILAHGWSSAVLGPFTTLACPAPLRRGAGGFLSTASVRARSRRLSLAATPLIIAVALSAVQVFTTTTMIAAARQQASSGLTADYVLTGTGSGLAPGIAEAVRGVRGVLVVTPVARTQVLASFRFGGDPTVESFSAQGVTRPGWPTRWTLTSPRAAWPPCGATRWRSAVPLRPPSHRYRRPRP